MEKVDGGLLIEHWATNLAVGRLKAGNTLRPIG
jgi:hypothetical protein